MTFSHSDIDELLPLPPATFHILIAVADESRHGYAIIQDIAARTNGELQMSAGTLYRSIQRMQEQGLIVESRRRPDPEDDDDDQARAEARRLSDLVRLARARGIAPERP